MPDSTNRPVEVRLRAAVESSPSGLLMIDAEGRIVLVNRQVETLFGYSREELLGKPVEMLVPERFRTGHAGFRGGFMADPRTRAMGAGRDLFGLHKSGAEIPVEIGLNPVITDEGIFVISSIVDISARRRAEQALKDSEERFRLLVNGVREYAVIMLDPEGRVISWNDGAERIIGYRAEEILGEPVQRFYQPHEVDQARTHLDLVRQAGSFEDETMLVRKDGSGFLANLTTTALLDERGKPRGFAQITRDITERRQLEEQLRQAQKLEAVGTLAGGIAHDFNNILGAIIGYGELVREQVRAQGAVRDDVGELLRSADRGKKLVERILAFSRRQEPTRRPLLIRSVVEEALQLLRATMPATIKIESRVEGGDPRILGDPTAVQQILLNLSTNAAHAMPDGGTLQVEIKPLYVQDSMARSNPDLHEGPYILLTVRDTGHGMDASTRSRVFEPFFTTKEPGRGTGLGLAMVHTVMREHEGTVMLDSTPGVGTEVRCLFPELESETSETAPPDLEVPRGGGERVLFLDDEPSLARLGERRLGSLGYAVTAETEAAQALARLRADPAGYDLVITDYTMPHMTGLEVARQIHAIRRDIPVVMVTGFIEDMPEEILKSSGITRVVRKPLTMEHLATVVAQVLGRV